jgi:hypothetical protein
MTDDKEKQIEMALRKYAYHYASHEKEDEPQQYTPEELALRLRIYSTYAGYMATKRIEKLTVILAYSTFALAAATMILAIDALLRILAF